MEQDEGSMHWEYGDSGNEFVRLTVTGPAPGPELARKLVKGEYARRFGDVPVVVAEMRSSQTDKVVYEAGRFQFPK